MTDYDMPCPSSTDASENTANYYNYGQRFNAGHTLIGQEVHTVVVPIYAGSSASGTTNLAYYASGTSGCTTPDQTSNENPSASSLPSDRASALAAKTTFTFSPAITVAAGDIFCIRNTGYGMVTTTSGDSDPNSDFMTTENTSCNWLVFGSTKPSQACATYKYGDDPPPSSDAVLLPPEPAMVRL